MANNQYIAPRRLYLDKDGNVVEADDPNRVSLLVGEGGSLPEDMVAKYNLRDLDSSGKKAQDSAPESKAVSKPPANKAAGNKE